MCSLSTCELIKPVSVENVINVLFLKGGSVRLVSMSETLLIGSGAVDTAIVFSIDVSEDL